MYILYDGIKTNNNCKARSSWSFRLCITERLKMKKSITKNYIYNLIYEIITIVIPIITTPYLSQVLGAENIGIYSYTFSIVTYFVLFGSLGIAMYGRREIAYVQQDKVKRSKILWEIIILRFCTMFISTALFYIFFANGKQYQIYYKILILKS